MNVLKFTNQSYGEDTDHVLWSFGDGSSQASIALTIDHTYASSGDYTVTLEAWSTSNQYGYSTKVVHIPASEFDVVAVAVGGQGRIYSTFDGSGWLPRESNFDGALYSVVFHDGTWNASGSGATLLKSGDGIEWDKTTVEIPEGEWTSLYKILYVHDQYFLLGQNFILSSPNSIDWTSRYIGVTTSQLQDLAYGDGTYVAVTYNSSNFYPTLVVSTDSTNWTAYDQTTLPHPYYSSGIVFSDHTWYFAIQSNPAMAYCAVSTDLTSWTLNNLDYNFLPTSITKLNGTFFITAVLGWPSTVLKSNDASNWSGVVLPTWEETNWVSYSQKYSKYFIASEDGAIFDSTDGTNWHENRLYPYENISGIATIDEPLS
jgi:hypothetical protein